MLFAAEVNLIKDSMTTGAPNMINRVIPNVDLDMLSYSSYDTQDSPEDFPAALQFMAQQHRRTEHSPPGNRAIFVAEFGKPQQHTNPAILQSTVRNVVNSALSFGAGYVLFWETYCNECTVASDPGCSDNRCRDPKYPVDNPDHLNGFWLVKPDGSVSWPRSYLAKKIRGEEAELLI